MFPKVSIITVVYNCKDGFLATMKSISGLHYDNLEVVVIDGGSTDGTLDVITSFSGLITYSVSEPDGGIYDAMNKGIEVATGDYLWFLNAGDLAASPGVLHDIFQGRETYADIYYGDTIITSDAGETLGLRKKRLPRRLTWHSFRRGMVVCHQSIIVSRKIAELYDLSYRVASDIDWVLKALKKASTIENSGVVISRFAEGGTSSQRRRTALKERFAIMRKYYGLGQTVISHIGFVFEMFRPKYR